MNIQGLQTSITATGTERVGGRLDIQSDTPALSHSTPGGPASAPSVSAPSVSAPSVSALDGAHLLDVLDPQERQALAAAFGQAKTPAYSGRGTTIRESPLLGTQLDLEA